MPLNDWYAHTYTHKHTSCPPRDGPTTSEAGTTNEPVQATSLPVTLLDPIVVDDTLTVTDQQSNSQIAQHMEAGQSADAHEQEDSLSLPIPFSPSQQQSPVLQENIVTFAEKYSLDLASKRFKVPVATIKKWMKASSVPVRPKYNSPGQGRKISYSAELEQAMAEHIRELLAKGEKVSTHSICSYARSRVQEEIPEFTASSGWAHRFMARNNIDLTGQREPRKEVTPPKDTRVPDSRGRPLSYSVETDQTIANYVRQNLADGHCITNSELRRHAKELIIKENPNFTGSASWAQNFLFRHKLNLQGLETKDHVSISSSPVSTPSSSIASSSAITSSHSTSLLYTQTQFASSVLSSSAPHFASTIPGVTTISVTDNPLGSATEMHVSASTASYANSGLTDGVMNLPAEYGTDDPMKQALAILTGESIDTGILSAAQVASLQSTLSELTSDTVSLVDLLNTAQHLQEQSGESGTVALITQGLESPVSGLYLGINTGSDVFGSGLTGVAATQVNPNTQAPTVPRPPRAPVAMMQLEADANPSSRPLSYAKETDQILAKWVQEQQAAGKKVTFASLRAYAKKLVSSENPNFNASVGWVTPFLLRHGLDLSINKKKGSRKAGADVPGENEGHNLAEEHQEDLSKQASAVQHVVQEEQQITPEQMMVPMHAVTSASTSIPHVPPVIATSVAGCSPAILEGLRAVLEQGIQNLAADCNPAEQMQFAQFQEQPLALAQTPTSLSQTAQDIPHMASVESQVLSEGHAQRTTVMKRPFDSEENDDDDDKATPGKKRVKTQRTRHRLSEKLDVVRLMRENCLAPHYVCRMLGIANSTLAGWIKLVQQKGAELEALSLNKKRSNLSGQGRPLTYSREKDDTIAQWVQTQQRLGAQVMPAELAKYAQSMIREENPNFTASSGWAQKFLQRHGLQLAARSSGSGSTAGPSRAMAEDMSSPAAVLEDQQDIPAAVQTEEVIAHEYSFERPYSEETEKHLVAWVKEKVEKNANLSLQVLCCYAEEIVIPQNPMFVASLSWSFMFLFTHGLLLDPKPSITPVRSTPTSRKRASSRTLESSEQASQSLDLRSTPKKLRPDVVSNVSSMSPSTGNLCEALLALSNQSQDGSQPSNSSVQAVLQVALRALHQQQKQQLEVQVEGMVGGMELAQGDTQGKQGAEEGGKGEGILGGNDGAGGVSRMEEVAVGEEKERAERGGHDKAKDSASTSFEVTDKDSSSNTYFGKPAREFSVEEKEEVVRYANATTLQKAALKYGVAAPTVWRWRVELKLHQPKYSAMQKKYIIKFAETNSLKEAAQRYGITGKTIQNWRKALQADGELSGDISSLLTQEAQADIIESAASQESQVPEMVFQFVVDGGEVVEMTGVVSGNESGNSGNETGGREGSLEQGSQPPVVAVTTSPMQVGSLPLEVTSEVDIENVGMEYDVISSEGHVAKPRCTPQEKVQILQYALDHSIKEASQKFGVSPGTLYYWKRSRSSGKESGKEGSDLANEEAPGSIVNQTVANVPQVVEYVNLPRQANVLDLNPTSSENVVIQPEQFIATSSVPGGSTASDAQQAATIHTLSQALAGMSPAALQHLHPDLTLLQAVSSLLAGGGGGAGGAGEEGRGSATDKRRDSHSEGISSPTEVLVRPFPSQQPSSSSQKGEEGAEGESRGEGEGRADELTPQVVSEEVVTMGDGAELTVPLDEGSSKPVVVGTHSSRDVPASLPTTLTPLDPVTTVAVVPSSSSEEVSQAQPAIGAPVDLEVMTLPPQSSFNVPRAGVVIDIPTPPTPPGAQNDSGAGTTVTISAAGLNVNIPTVGAAVNISTTGASHTVSLATTTINISPTGISVDIPTVGAAVNISSSGVDQNAPLVVSPDSDHPPIIAMSKEQ